MGIPHWAPVLKGARWRLIPVTGGSAVYPPFRVSSIASPPLPQMVVGALTPYGVALPKTEGGQEGAGRTLRLHA
ncbi:hypothetical protein ACVWZX_004591 [Deinococcus sp. UYEF24]